MIVDNPIISRRIFFPRPTDQEASLFVEVEGARIACYLRSPYRDAGILLCLHGNGELASEYAEQYAEMFLAMGVNVCFAEYRGYGLSTGEPALGAMLSDGEAVVRALGIAPERVVVFGRSLGSLYAIELAWRLPRIAGLILESAIADVRENWPLTRELQKIGCCEEEYVREVAAHFDHRQKLAGYYGPLLVLHAGQDQFLDPSHAERLYTWGAGHEKKLVILPHGNHNSIFFANYVEYLGEFKAFLQRSDVLTAY